MKTTVGLVLIAGWTTAEGLGVPPTPRAIVSLTSSASAGAGASPLMAIVVARHTHRCIHRIRASSRPFVLGATPGNSNYNDGDEMWFDDDGGDYYYDEREEPFSRGTPNNNYDSNAYRRSGWNNEQQRDYRQDRLKRDASWPQQQQYKSYQKRPSPMASKTINVNAYTDDYSDDYADDEWRGSDYGEDEYENVDQGRGGSAPLSSFLNKNKNSLDPWDLQGKLARARGSAKRNSLDPKRPPQTAMGGSNIVGERYTNNFGRGTPNKGTARNPNDFREYGRQNYADQRQYSQARENDLYNMDDQSDGFMNEQPPQPQFNNNREMSFNKRRPTSSINNNSDFGGQKRYNVPTPPQQQLPNSNSNNDDYRRRGERQQQFGREIAFDSLRQSPYDTPPIRSYYYKDQNNNMDYRRRGERQQQFGREVAFDKSRSESFGSNNYRERQQQLFETKSTTFGQQPQPPLRPMQAPQRPMQAPQRPMQSLSSGPMRTITGSRSEYPQPLNDQVRLQPYDDNLPMRQPQSYSEPPRETKKEEPFGFGIRTLKRIFDGITNTNTGNNSNTMSEEEKITRNSLTNAQTLLSLDPTVQAALGTSLTIGNLYSRSYSSTMVNGTSRARLQLTFPVTGSEGTGRGLLVATNREGIVRLEVDFAGSVIPVVVENE